MEKLTIEIIAAVSGVICKPRGAHIHTTQKEVFFSVSIQQLLRDKTITAVVSIYKTEKQNYHNPFFRT